MSTSNTLAIDTPAALIDLARMDRNIAAMQSRMNSLGVKFRPHVKTSKCVAVTQRQIGAGAQGITVSTLKEAEQFFAAGCSDILYAVAIAPAKLAQVLALMRKGCNLKIITDNEAAAQAIVEVAKAQQCTFNVWLEIDTDGHRAGLKPHGDALLKIAKTLHEGGVTVGGVMTHAGESYSLHTPEALQAMAEQERSLCVLAAERIRAVGIACPVVSVGSTPTALSAQRLEGATEVRAGVYVFFDLVMANVGVCKLSDIALSVLTTVIGHQSEKGWAIVDAGWMAMSRDRGTQSQKATSQKDYGYGQVCDLEGDPIEGYIIGSANQEHGILCHATTCDQAITERFPVGMQLRILPNHACATGAQFPEYQAISEIGHTPEIWPRFYGW